MDACFKVSKLWEHVQVMHLSTNMRVHLRTGTLAGKSADCLLNRDRGVSPLVRQWTTLESARAEILC